MTDIFQTNDIVSARKERGKLLTIWICITAVFIGLILFFTLYNVRMVNLYRDRSLQLLFTILSVLTTVLYGCFTLFFFSLKFRLTHKYCKLLKNIETGLKDEATGAFIEYDESITQKDGLEFYSLCLNAKPLKREDITFRKVLIEHTVPKIELEAGTQLKIKTHANVLVSYEILSGNKAVDGGRAGEVTESGRGE